MPRFLFSFSLFLALALGFGCVASIVQDKYAYPVHTWSWWSVDAMKKLNGAPNTVLIGSSLMVVAMAECDATVKGERLDLTTYRQARYLDRALAKCAGVPSYTINLASPGQIPTDAYLTLKAALNEGVLPERVIYGVAPRDFLDSTMASSVDTECFKYLSRIVSARELQLHTGFTQAVARKITETLPLLRSAVDLQMLSGQTLSDLFDSRLPDNKLPLEKRMALLSSYEPLDMVPGFIHAEVAKEESAEREKLYKDNLADYKARYAKPKREFYDEQMNALKQIMLLCRDHGIELSVVNMPIRECNAKLIDRSCRERYLKDLTELTAAYGVPYADLCRFDLYARSDYADSCHLNGYGGKKFIDQLALFMSQQETLRAVCQTGNRESQL